MNTVMAVRKVRSMLVPPCAAPVIEYPGAALSLSGGRACPCPGMKLEHDGVSSFKFDRVSGRLVRRLVVGRVWSGLLLRIVWLGILLMLGVMRAAEAAESAPYADIAWPQHPRLLPDVGQLLGRASAEVPSRANTMVPGAAESRYWGVGVAFSSKRPIRVPMSGAALERFVDELSAMGINHVRLVGLDNNYSWPMRSWIRDGSLDQEAMERLGRFLSILRQRRITYSFSVNNNGIVMLDGRISPNPDAATPLFRYKAVRLYDDRALALAKGWYRSFFGWSPDPKVRSIARDPLNLYASVVNEDSIFSQAYRDFRGLDKTHLDRLSRLFGRFLLDEYQGSDAYHSAWASDGRHCISDLSPARAVPVPRLVDGCGRRNHDVVQFLSGVDAGYYCGIAEVLRDAGYRGWVSGTNNWYGYGALKASIRCGNATETHGYFDHPRRRNLPLAGRLVGYEGRSYVATTPDHYPWTKGQDPLSKSFATALSGYPHIISEWGHAAWSPYAYEGPLMVAAYAAYQGYEVAAAHTYFNHPHPDPDIGYTRDAFQVRGNPVLSAMMPSLALAFRRGDVQVGRKMQVIDCAWVDAAAAPPVVQLRQAAPECPVDWRLGLSTRLRVRLVDQVGVTKMGAVAGVAPTGPFVTDTGQIRWAPGDTPASFSVDAPRFKAVALSAAGDIRRQEFSARLLVHGGVIMISLDGAPLRSSQQVLVTLVQSARNTGMDERHMGGVRWIRHAGNAPAHLRVPGAVVTLKRDDSILPNVCGLAPDGMAWVLQGAARYVSSAQEVRVVLDPRYGPWYLLDFTAASDGACDTGSQG